MTTGLRSSPTNESTPTRTATRTVTSSGLNDALLGWNDGSYIQRSLQGFARCAGLTA